jgi:CO dehydrogenase nickel-insertion accessory protein CooC1
MKPSAVKLIVNRAPDGRLMPGIEEEIAKHGFDFAGIVPADEQIAEFDGKGIPTAELPADSKARKAFEEILEGFDFGRA